jgi:sugar lactone lactonase YvrE
MTRNFKTLADGCAYFEGTRWHDGRWYASDALAGVVCAFEPSGEREDLMQVDALCSGLGWLQDGSLLVVSMKDRALLRKTPDGRVSTHADLSHLTPHWINDMWVDNAGRAWVGTIGFAIHEGADPEPGDLFRVDPDGTVTVTARDLWCPNGIVTTGGDQTLAVAESFAARITAFTITGDGSLTGRRTLAQFGEQPKLAGAPEMVAAMELTPDGMTVDADDHIWVADAGGHRVVRVSPIGEIVDVIAHPDGTNIYTCAIGGPDGHQLLIAASEGFFEALAGVRGTAELIVTEVNVPAPAAPPGCRFDELK